jgi:hypothetical protein
MNMVLDLPGKTFVAPGFRRRRKIACLHPEAGPDRRRACGRCKLGVHFHEDLQVSLEVKRLASGGPPAVQENQTDKK